MAHPVIAAFIQRIGSQEQELRIRELLPVSQDLVGIEAARRVAVMIGGKGCRVVIQSCLLQKQGLIERFALVSASCRHQILRERALQRMSQQDYELLYTRAAGDVRRRAGGKQVFRIDLAYQLAGNIFVKAALVPRDAMRSKLGIAEEMGFLEGWQGDIGVHAQPVVQGRRARFLGPQHHEIECDPLVIIHAPLPRSPV